MTDTARTVVLATHNQGKVVELRDILGDALGGVELVAYDGPEPVEDGQDSPEQAELAYELLRSAQGCGYATEAAAAVVGFGFETLELARIVATTEHRNVASQAVMRRLGMRIETNPDPEPPWFQVVGILDR